ncbi:MAG: hypothetical protein V3W41_16040, partial [Planctomycetota bacterium]
PEVFEGMARMPNTRMNEAQNPMSLKERGDKSPNCPRLSWLLTAREAGITQVGLNNSRSLRRPFRLSRRMRVATVSPRALKPTIVSLVKKWPGQAHDDLLWFDERKSARKGHDAVSGSALMLAALALHEQMDAEAVEHSLVRKCLLSVIESAALKGLSDGGSLRRHAWLCFSLVKIAQLVDVDELADLLPSLLEEVVKTHLKSGGWPETVGQLTPDLVTSTVMAITLREAADQDLFPLSGFMIPGDAAWMNPRTDAGTGFWAVHPAKFDFSRIDGEAMHRITLGFHPESHTAYAAAYRIALGENPKKGVLELQLQRLLDLPPPTAVASNYFDSEHAIMSAWICDRLDDRSWRAFNGILATAMNSHISRSEPLRVRLTGDREFFRSRYMTDARLAIALAFLLDFKPKRR